jgi:hypothetical protein
MGSFLLSTRLLTLDKIVKISIIIGSHLNKETK